MSPARCLCATPVKRGVGFGFVALVAVASFCKAGEFESYAGGRFRSYDLPVMSR